MANPLQSSRDEFRLARPSSIREPDLEQVRLAVEEIRHGEVRVVIQDGVIIQIDRLEKQRLR